MYENAIKFEDISTSTSVCPGTHLEKSKRCISQRLSSEVLFGFNISSNLCVGFVFKFTTELSLAAPKYAPIYIFNFCYPRINSFS